MSNINNSNGQQYNDQESFGKPKKIRPAKIFVYIVLAVIVLFAARGIIGQFINGSDNAESDYVFEDIGSLVIDVSSADVIINTSNNKSARIEVTGAKEFVEDIKVSGNNKELKIEQKSRTNIFKFSFSNNSRVTLYLPNDQFSNIDIKTSSGNVIAEYLQGGKITVSTTSGNVEIDNCYADSYKVNTSSGNIKTNGEFANKSVFRASSGDIRLSGFNGEKLEAGTSSGKINISNILDSEKFTKKKKKYSPQSVFVLSLSYENKGVTPTQRAIQIVYNMMKRLAI